MRILLASMPVLALLSIFALGASARVEARVDKECDGSYFTSVSKHYLIKGNQQSQEEWDVQPS